MLALGAGGGSVTFSGGVHFLQKTCSQMCADSAEYRACFGEQISGQQQINDSPLPAGTDGILASFSAMSHHITVIQKNNQRVR
jgi:hypothetical protein